MATTTNFGWNKPAASDTTGVRVDINAILDAIDTSVFAHVPKSLFDAHTMLYATADNTPVALTVGASTFVGRKSTGNIAAMSVAEVKTELAYVAADLPTLAPLASPTFTGTVNCAALTASGLITADGSILAANGAGGGTGGLQVGDMGAGASSYYGIAHSSNATTTNYALIQNASGQTAINAKTGQTVSLGINNSVKLTLAATTLTFADAVNMVFNATTGTKIGTAITEKIGFYGVTPIAQRAGAAQAAVATTGATNITPFGYTTAAQADAIVTLVNELRAWAVAQGFIKGAA